MKRHILIVASVAIIASCSTSKKSGKTVTQSNSADVSNAPSNDSGKQDGLSFKNAVYITENSEATGPSAEYKWIKQHYTDYKVKGQALVYNANKPFDIITIVFNDGKELKIYFDISNYFGKF